MSETAYARRMRHRESRGRWLRPGTKYRYQARPLAWYDATDAGCWRTSEDGRHVQAILTEAVNALTDEQLANLVNSLGHPGEDPVDRWERERQHRAEYETRPPTPRGPICPECKAGKHRNCDGTAWDIDRDQRTDCGCFLTSPIEHGS